MLSTIASRSVRLGDVVPRAIVGRLYLTTGNFASKEKIEEERYAKAQTAIYLEKKKAESDAKLKAEALKHFEEQIAPAMVKIESALAGTGDKLSLAGLEAIARLKLSE